MFRQINKLKLNVCVCVSMYLLAIWFAFWFRYTLAAIFAWWWRAWCKSCMGEEKKWKILSITFILFMCGSFFFWIIKKKSNGPRWILNVFFFLNVLFLFLYYIYITAAHSCCCTQFNNILIICKSNGNYMVNGRKIAEDSNFIGILDFDFINSLWDGGHRIVAIGFFNGISLLTWSHLYETPFELIVRLSIDSGKKINNKISFQWNWYFLNDKKSDDGRKKEGRNRQKRKTSHWIGINWFTIC